MNHVCFHQDDPNAAWLGEDLLERQDWRQDLCENEVEECIEAAALLANGFDEKKIDQTLARCLPNLSDRLKHCQNDLESKSGATIIHGFPLDHMDKHAAGVLFTWMMKRIGTPVAQTTDGDEIFHVRDEGFKSDDPRARGPNSKNRLTFHSDRCDVICFLCMQEAMQGGENQIVSSVSLYQRIQRDHPDLLKVLMQPFWYQRHNVDSGNEHAFYQQPIFSFCEGRFASSLLRVLIDRAYRSPETPEMTEQQRHALDLVETLASDPGMHLEFRQQRGDILLLNNFVTLHRRKAFEDDGRNQFRRHLLRIWLSMPNSRPIDPMFSASYGQTSAGALRGGMRVR